MRKLCAGVLAGARWLFFGLALVAALPLFVLLAIAVAIPEIEEERR